MYVILFSYFNVNYGYIIDDNLFDYLWNLFDNLWNLFDNLWNLLFRNL